MANMNITRRGFIQGMSALSFAFAVQPKSVFGAKPSPFSPHGILRIEPDNTIHITMPTPRSVRAHTPAWRKFWPTN